MTESASTHAPVRVVGIGASAGGLDALERFFDNLPRETGMAFVVVQHLSPDFKSVMTELLARHTELPLRLVEDGILVEPDRVYLIPAGKEMIISGGRLLLSDRGPQHELTLPIDVFFRSLAQDCGSRAVAIVLSGGGSDGSRGIRDVDDAGGLVIVQDAESAQFDGMPRMALDAGVAHWVLAPQDMPRVLVQDVQNKLVPPSPDPSSADQLTGLPAVYRMLQDEFGIDFTHYKPNTVTRRIERRLALARSPNLDEYLRRLRAERQELDLLYRDLLIGVTSFFRDPKAFEALEALVQDLVQQSDRNASLRFWIAGCATGEEAYSLAIVLTDALARHGERDVKIFATDAHRGSLDLATRAVYDAKAVANVSPERLARYFLRIGEAYQVVPELRQMIVFAQHNVITDAPFTRIDLIACRNLLIYLQQPVQRKVLSLFHFALNQGGMLMLGPSETVGSLEHAFEPLDRGWRVYRKQRDVRIPVDRHLLVPVSPPLVLPGPHAVPPGRRSTSQLLATYDAILDEMMPPSFLVNDSGELVHVFGGASRFLRPRDGRASLGLLDQIDGELKTVLTGGLKRALGEEAAIVYKGVRVTVGGESPPHTITIRCLRDRGAAGAPPGTHLLVSFEPMEVPIEPSRPSTEIDLDQVSRHQLAALEAELAYTKQALQTTIEESEASNEELQASNEELQTSNEELQSTNEELQSVNEELYTVNAEYQRKIAELTELTNDMDNLLAATDVGTIFLDAQLRIRKFTPQIAEAFDLVPHDVGRSIETFTHKLDHPELIDELRSVLSTGEPIERELRSGKGRWFFLRILPYRVKGTPDGVVLTLIDVSGLKAAEDALFHERYLLDSLLGTVPDAIYFKDGRGKFIRVNHAMATRLGLSDPRAAVGKSPGELIARDAELAVHHEDDAVLRSGEPQHYRIEERSLPDGAIAWDLVTRLPLRDREERIVGVIVILRDITEQRRAEEKVQHEVRRRDQFLAMLSHELRNPLGAIVTATGLLRAPEGERPPADRLIAVLDRQSQQMARLLDDLLEASRVTQNKIELKTRPVELRSVIADIVDAEKGRMESRGIDLSVAIEPESIAVDGDPARLQQILVNLLSNSAKYTPRGGHVHLSAIREHGAAVIRVRDDGAGIPPEMLESVFELFVQSNRALDRSTGGLGVGLTLVRALVELHGGTVSAHSGGEGKGCEVVVRLPLSTSTAAARSERPPPPPRPPVALPESARIVVVEDNADSRELLCELLKRTGFDCHGAAGGLAALELIDRVEPDIALLDLGLPEMDGFELARRLRQNPKHARMLLVALTGYGQASDRAATRAAGFDEHLVKPARRDDLLRLLADLRRAPRERPVQTPTNGGRAM